VLLQPVPPEELQLGGGLLTVLVEQQLLLPVGQSRVLQFDQGELLPWRAEERPM
jgi:hypothetical protein